MLVSFFSRRSVRVIRWMSTCLGALALGATSGVLASTPSGASPGGGYRLVAGDGGVFSFGAPFFGSPASTPSTCVAVAPSPVPSRSCTSMTTTATGDGYWILNGSTGAITEYGDAVSYGTPAATFAGVPRDLVPWFHQIVATADGRGYWVLAIGLSGLGSVEGFGDAHTYGDETATAGPRGHVGSPVTMAPTPTANGYWIADSDGGVFSFGDARFYGSMGGKSLDAPVVGMTATADGKGYWLVAADGGVFSFGDATFYGSMGGKSLNAPVVGMTATADGLGYWLVAADGGVFSFGDARFYGSMGGKSLDAPVVGISASPPE